MLLQWHCPALERAGLVLVGLFWCHCTVEWECALNRKYRCFLIMSSAIFCDVFYFEELFFPLSELRNCARIISKSTPKTGSEYSEKNNSLFESVCLKGQFLNF